MGKVHLITGYMGEEHIQSADQGSFNASFFGGGEYVMEAGNQFEASIMDNNTVRILDGDLLMQGRHIRIEPDTYEDITITTGTAGVNRIDLIVMQYSKDTSTDIESAELVVIKGTESEGTATEPEYTSGDILHGATLNQMPLYRVKVEGVVLTEIEPLFNVIPTYKTLAEQYAKQFQEACNTYIGLLNILDTMEEVEANTQEGQLAGALSVKELKNTLQTAIDSKVTNSFTANRALISNANGNVSVSGTTVTELGYVHGVTSAIQTQLNAKLPLAGGTMTGKLTSQSVVPSSPVTYACGSLGSPFLGTYAKGHYLLDANLKNCGQFLVQAEGTTSAEGVAGLWLGNSLAKGTDGNSRGQVVLFNTNANYAYVYANPNMTANAGMVLSSKGGTIPTVSLSGTKLTINI